ncbi:MAG: DUF4102 domain-containing protein [Candidatus Melainabacteria bacterium]|nr:MAG: DUF4102 domain-containing protein [Candidatus Melainabacteria bacterium]
MNKQSESNGHLLVTCFEGNDQVMKLTQASILGITYSKIQGSQDVRWDDTLPGFGVRVYPTGKKSFVVKYRIHGRQRTMVIAPCNLMTLEEARNRAKRIFVNILDGKDPLAEREKKPILFDELCVAYMERHSKPYKSVNESREDQRRIDNYLLPAWRNRAVASIEQSDVAALHSKIGINKVGKRGGPYAANRVRELIHKMFECAKIYKMLEAHAINPAKGIEDFPEKARSRFVTEDEMPRLAQAISAYPNPYIQAALWLYLLTGLRHQELLRLKWTDIDFTARMARIGLTKNGLVHYAPLSAAAVEILRRIPRKQNNSYVFCGHLAGKPLYRIQAAWKTIRKNAGIEDVLIHDLRRTCGAWLAMSGHSLPVISKVLNQTNEQVTAVYARISDPHAKGALESHGAKVAKFIRRKDRRA